MIPTRHLNPFATCWTKPGALPYRFANGENPQRIVARLAQDCWRGQIIGPHGVGKSALLATLIEHLRQTGMWIHVVTLRDRQRRLPAEFRAQIGWNGDTVLAIDGFEKLSCWRRELLKLRCRRSRTGLLVTAHRTMGLPTLAELSPSVGIVQQLVDQLTAKAARRIQRDEVTASFDAHNGNVREILFDLYDRYERQSRPWRTRPGVPA